MKKDIKSIRLENLNWLMRKLREEHPHGTEHGMLSRFSEKVGVSAAYLSHIRNGRKNVGHATARSIERGFRLPENWMDQDHCDELTPEQEKRVKVLNGMSDEMLDAMVAMLKAAGKL